ncbi:MAG: peptide-binding protein [Thermodesulfobacteriota bacterium]|nr:peptide-binding protein [Thermodesulfobacteriota bacterium]
MEKWGGKKIGHAKLATLIGISLCILSTVFSPGCDKAGEKPFPAEVKQDTSDQGQPAYGDLLIQGSIGDASNLIPMLASDSASHEIASKIFNGLVKYDKDLNLVGDLAESWEVSPDGLTITFKLRKGVKWQDGVEFTAEDVMFGFKTIINPNTRTAYGGDFKEVKEAVVVDRHTFRVTYKRPFAPGLASWGSLVVLPKHLLEGKDINTTPFSRKPIGMGPYLFQEWKTGEKIVLQANPNYFEGRPYIDGFIYRIIPDLATMFLELMAGGLDYMGLTPLQYNRQTDTYKMRRDFRKYRFLAFAYTYLGYNLKDWKFQDQRVRQAITYAIDKEEIIEGVLLGMGLIATGPYKPDTSWYNPNVRKYPYNVEKARRLLAEAGWKDTGKDGILRKEGKPFEFTILTNQGNETRAKCAEIIQRRLGMIGIKVKIRTVEWAAFINDFIDKKNFEAVILGWTLGQDPDIYDIWHSSKVGVKELNFIFYQNKEVDALLEKGRYTFDLKVRKACYDRIQEILAEDQPYTFLFVPYALPIISSRFKGIKPAPAGIAHNIPKWYVPRPEQRYLLKP